MQGLTRTAVRRPGATLVVWLVAVLALALVGLGVESRLTQSVFVLPGTETSRSFELAAEEFGESVIIPVLLEGPEEEINQQGPALVATLSARNDTRVLSPWDRAEGIGQLRPSPEAALILATFDVPFEEAFDTLAPEVRSTVDAQVRPPLEARVTGMPIIGNDIKQETYESADRAELLAMPILLVVLLLVFRAPIAAMIPALTGLATLFSSAGLIWLVAGFREIDPLAVALASMMGLALGVDYSLLIVSRFREELRAGFGPARAARTAAATAGRTVLFAGLALIVAMVVAMLVAPGALLVSAAVGVMASTLLSMFAALVAMPAALALLGPRIDLLRFGAGRERPRWIAGLGAVMARPGLVALVILVPLLFLSAPALALNTGPPDVEQLSEDSRARTDYERVREMMGPGWAAPFEVMLVSEEGPITESRRLRKIRRFQREVSRQPNVLNVVGPGRLLRQSRGGRRAGEELGRSGGALARARRGLRRLDSGIGDAQLGILQVDAGLAEAEAAAASLAAGNRRAERGEMELSEQLALAREGAALIGAASEKAERGAEQLADGLGRAVDAYGELIPALGFIKDKVTYEAVSAATAIAQSLETSKRSIDSLTERARVIDAALQDALAAVDGMTVGQADPLYGELREAIVDAYEQVEGTNPDTGEPIDPAYRGLVDELELVGISVGSEIANARRLAQASRELAAGLGEIKQGAGELRGATRSLQDGAEELGDGISRIRGALGGMEDGLERLSDGSERLEGGLNELSEGSDDLAGGLGDAGAQLHPLISGLGAASYGAQRLRRGARGDPGALLEASPALFESGYFVLAAIDGSGSERSERAELAVNVSGGGQAARVVVVPTTAPNSPETAALRDELSERAGALGEEIGAEAAVGGTAAALAEYDDITSSRLPLLIAALAIASYLVLIPIFRSLLLPLIAVLLNLLSVAVAFAALALLFQGETPPLGGPGYLDAVSISAIYTVIFGLSLDYQVFLITRMREGWEHSGDNEAAITYGLERTAGVVTGAAAIMTAVFLAFAMSEITNTRQFGVGLAIAVIVDATIVRLLLLPAMMRLCGSRCWSLPRGLERRLPRMNV